MNLYFRLGLAIVLVLLVWGATWALQFSLATPSNIQHVDWKLAELPLDLREWRGQEVKLDEKLAAATGAADTISRRYRHPLFGDVSMHCALYEEPVQGVSHTPIYCYRGQGWRLVSDERVELPLAADQGLPMSFSTWEKDNDRIRVAYFFQMGEYVLFNRYDLGRVRLNLAGRSEWPIMVKVLLQCNATDNPEVDKNRTLNFAKEVYTWLLEKDQTVAPAPQPN